MIAAPTFSQIRAQATAILQRSNGSKVVGIHAKGRWTGDQLQSDGTQRYLIEQCDSPLALRIALNKYEELSEDSAQNETIQVLVTPLMESELAEDILLRLAKQRLFTIDPWQIIKSLFSATSIDPRLISHRWIPEILIDWMPANRYAPVLGGFLDAEIIWPLLLHHGINLRAERPDLTTILEWSVSAENVERYQKTSDEFRDAAVNWLAELVGFTAKIVFSCVAHNKSPDALPLGLAAEIICHPETQGKLDKGLGKLEERFLGGETLTHQDLEIWSAAAKATINQLSANIRLAIVQRSDEILGEIGAEQFAHLSSISSQGFNQRLTSMSENLVTLLRTPIQLNLLSLKQAFDRVIQHQSMLDLDNQRRLQRIQMSLRLSQWLVGYQARPTPFPKALEEAITYHAQEGGFLDWARLTLPIAEPHQELSTAFGKLFDAVTEIRESQAYQFAKLLQDWTDVGSTRQSVTLIENILETVVAPLAATHPVLLIVMDGMSFAVCNELLSHLNQMNWHLIVPKTNSQLGIQAGLAVIPSVTEVSRTSLLCGKLEKGNQGKEKLEFAKHSALLQQCKRNFPPLLFHKDAMQSTGASVISSELVGAIESSTNRIIGLVINAVDDLLSNGDQVDIAWTGDRIKVLQPILQAAKNAGRIVIITSDHGHVLHNDTKFKKYASGERWRDNDGQPDDKELKVEGNRVISSNGHSIIVPWTEKLRYCKNKKNGYHGGINPQEMVIPITVLTSTSTNSNSWKIADLPIPEWWKINSVNDNEEKDSIELQKLDNSSLGPLFSYGVSIFA